RQTDRQTGQSVCTNESSSVTRCNGLIGVPITFLDKYCPEQFELLGVFNHGSDGPWDFAPARCRGTECYKRLAIRAKV
ncbi:MAG: hypothetical protein IJI45_14405, partial [Anaerolineaceae bacterium]|nr:hypothetical protein [Anaerolineaceae bacterium]